MGTKYCMQWWDSGRIGLELKWVSVYCVAKLRGCSCPLVGNITFHKVKYGHMVRRKKIQFQLRHADIYSLPIPREWVRFPHLEGLVFNDCGVIPLWSPCHSLQDVSAVHLHAVSHFYLLQLPSHSPGCESTPPTLSHIYWLWSSSHSPDCESTPPIQCSVPCPLTTFPSPLPRKWVHPTQLPCLFMTVILLLLPRLWVHSTRFQSKILLTVITFPAPQLVSQTHPHGVAHFYWLTLHSCYLAGVWQYHSSQPQCLTSSDCSHSSGCKFTQPTCSTSLLLTVIIPFIFRMWAWFIRQYPTISTDFHPLPTSQDVSPSHLQCLTSIELLYSFHTS